MSELQHRINYLQQRLDDLAKYQINVRNEIRQMQTELNALRTAAAYSVGSKPVQTEPTPPKTSTDIPPPEEKPYSPPFGSKPETDKSSSSERPDDPLKSAEPKPELQRSDLEKFVGENLLSKIGIVITVLGVGIGTKYAIDNNLISPWTRIFLGYLFGFGLLTLAVRLKGKYINFSAVLLSGSLAIMYFVTFFAFALYQLISQPAAFALMLIFTVFTVYMALIYNRVVIAQFGLVGAYTIPFLLSTGSENYPFLFSYITIINLGILAVSLKKYWTSLFYTSFTISWLIFWGWYLVSYRPAEHFPLGLTFAFVFFFTFYLTFLAYKSFSGEKLSLINVLLILINSFIFYGFGMAFIDGRTGGDEYLGLFTAVNALIHFIIGFGLARFQLAHKSAVLLATALVLTFLTITIPVQFKGNWITLLWTAEAFFLFWIGRTKRISLYEYFSYPLMFLATVSLLNDWTDTGFRFEGLPVANPDFITSIIYTAAFAAIHLVNQKFNPDFEDPTNQNILERFRQISTYVIPAAFLFALYNTFRIEIANYFQLQLASTAVQVIPPGNPDDAYFVRNKDLQYFNFITQINYTMLFLSVLSFVNIRRIRNPILGYVTLVLNALNIFVFITIGLVVLSLLRESYLVQFTGETLASDDPSKLFQSGVYNIGVRYVCLAFFAGLSLLTYRLVKQDFLTKYVSAGVLTVLFDLGLHLSLLVIVSFELVNWMDIFGLTGSFKLGLSILWGVYALFLIILGIYRHKKHLRISAIALFAITLIKLFFYDIAELDTISKTVVFVSLGILLLIISFLYTKYKFFIFQQNPPDENLKSEKTE